MGRGCGFLETVPGEGPLLPTRVALPGRKATGWEGSGYLLPPPDWPTRATILPGGSVRVKSLSTWKPGREG